MAEVGLIIGSARCLSVDLEAALRWFKPKVIIGINESGRDYPGHVDHWVSMHPEKMGCWIDERIRAGRPAPGTVWSPNNRNHPEWTGPMIKAESWGGSSGLFGIVVGLKGAKLTRLVLAGVPMDALQGHYHRPKEGRWLECDAYKAMWQRHLPKFKDHVRSMSGWTRDLLGAPTESWLNGQRS